MNDNTILQIKKFLIESTGINIDQYDDKIFFNKIKKIVKDRGNLSFERYYQILRNDISNIEIQNLIDEVTINTTEFYRHPEQLLGFKNDILTRDLANKKTNNEYFIRIWSAACSTGEEPYTIAILLKNSIPDFKNWRISIQATDIDTNALKHAEKGIYTDDDIRKLPQEYRLNYFNSKGERWEIEQELKDIVSFNKLNLTDFSSMSKMRSFDYIFCRNILIYFDEVMRGQILESLYNSLRPGGILFLGYSQARCLNLKTSFELVKIGNILCFQK